MAGKKLNPDISSDQTDWRTIVALNVTSTLSQLGQFGIGIVVLPLWLAEHGLNATQLGVFASSEWLGMFIGLAFTPQLNLRFGHRIVIAIGLIITIVGFGIILVSTWPVWLSSGLLIGLGMGLRWIGLEPWLYRILPSNARGRLVGFHETLMGIAPIVAPMLTAWIGISGKAPIYLGITFCSLALLPLMLAKFVPASKTESLEITDPIQTASNDAVLSLGVAIAVIGGITEASFSGLFPIFGAGRNLSANEMATLLSLFGLGGILLQYLTGWLADHRGLRFATLVCAISTAFFSAIASLPLGFLGLSITIFALGGTITAYLTLSIISATSAGDGDLSIKMRQVSMAYTASSIFGPILAGTIMKNLTSDALIWQVGLLAMILSIYLITKGRVIHKLRMHLMSQPS